MIKYPRYVKTLNQWMQPEWLVRSLDPTMLDSNGVLVPTPEDLFNRYYRHCGNLPVSHSVLQGKQFLRYLEIPKTKLGCEYDTNYFLRYSDLTTEELLNMQLPAIVSAFCPSLLVRYNEFDTLIAGLELVAGRHQVITNEHQQKLIDIRAAAYADSLAELVAEPRSINFSHFDADRRDYFNEWTIKPEDELRLVDVTQFICKSK